MRLGQVVSQLNLGLAVLAAFTQWTTNVHGHSWVDCIDHSYDVVYTNSDKWVLGGTNGNGVCEGYAYKFPGRGDQSIGTDYTWKLLPEQIHQDAPVCQYHHDQADYTGWRHVVHGKPGDKLYLAYFSNGHIVKDKAGSGTTWGVYWSGQEGVELTKPSELTKERLVDGKLNDFDDGNCGQTFVDGDFSGGTIPSGRAGDFKPCVGSFTIPTNAKAGTYQMVWYWTFYKNADFETNFATSNGAGGAAYSSCFDVVVDGSGDDSNNTTATVQLVQESAVLAAPVTTPAYTTEPANCGVEEPSEPATTTPAPIPTIESTEIPLAKVIPATESVYQKDPAPESAVVTESPTLAPTESPTSSPAPLPSQTIPPPANSSYAFSEPLAAVTINGVGGTGAYGKVTDMQCPSSNTCAQSEFAVSGPSAPFDEDLTLALRGPLNVDDLAVFTSADTKQWTRISSYSKQAASADNLVFMNNKGDPLRSGIFDMCNGNSQSYATADGTIAAGSAATFNGVLEDGVEINVMSGITCEGGSCGYSRGVAHEGWKGANKIFMIKAQMPHCPTGGKDVPSIWLLNGQIVRTAQYGCNCRGMGDQGKWKGGCGELDVAEVLPENVNGITSTIYSFKGSRGTNSYAARPTDTPVVFVVILTEQSTSSYSNLGMAQILMLNADQVDFSTPPSADVVSQWLAYSKGVNVNFDI
ncbi:hypothetical protein Poli38472_003053 [Pythium oligandrum]|uniref:glucan endo-1,3-beta-D-glucosidase n=1 Tax=Pythium oligandrum TaxID=41045 RepID=A0A8K1C6E5_PYTOL|nr:hypothetical protein Poli38472_003053 [Pythium oligandrum]|eukprot:TMW57128.1 hypothetical protein Poli38472_003053 [Pythium oligandrum]